MSTNPRTDNNTRHKRHHDQHAHRRSKSRSADIELGERVRSHHKTISFIEPDLSNSRKMSTNEGEHFSVQAIVIDHNPSKSTNSCTIFR